MAFVLQYFVHFFTPTFVPTFPSRPSRPSFPSIKDKKIFAVREFHEAKDIFERHFSISSILSEKRSRLQAHFVLNYTLLAEHSHPIIGVKVIQCLLQKKTFNVRLNYPRLLLVIPYRFGHICRLCLKKQGWKRVVNVKESIKYQEIANSIWEKYQTQQVVIRSYRRGRNNCPSKRTFRTDFAVFHSSNPEKKKGDLARTTWYDSKLCSVQHEYLRTFIHPQRDDMSWYLLTKNSHLQIGSLRLQRYSG